MSKPKRLTDTQCRNAKCPQGKPHIRLPDGDGLYLKVQPSGTKTWEMRLWFPAPHKGEGKQTEKTLTLGRYPAMTLQEAREKAAQAKKLKGQGVDPAEAKQQAKAAARQQAARSATFREVAEEFVAKWQPTWSESHTQRQMGALKNHLFPFIGERPIAELEPPDLLEAMLRVEKNGARDMAARVRALAGQVFRYAVSHGKAQRDISADLLGALAPRQPGHFAAITDPAPFGAFLRATRGYRGSFVVQCALRFAPLVFQRPGEVRGATWQEIDLDAAMWTIPAARMKRRKAGKEYGAPHLVPLSRQAVSILRELRPFADSAGHVFPGERRGRPISDNTVRTAFHTMGFASDVQTFHGLRASARTMLRERLGFPPEVIEEQLAHTKPDPLKGAYDRAEYMEQRIPMMQVWADYCDALADGVEPERAAEIAKAAKVGRGAQH